MPRACESSPFAESELAPGVKVAVGGPGQGIEGFRHAHRQARAAQRVALYRPGVVTRYEDVGLEVLVTESEAAAREFLVYELGPLLTDRPKDGRLLETLEAYFLAGQNANVRAGCSGGGEPGYRASR